MKAHLAGGFILTVLVLFACVHFAVANAKLRIKVAPMRTVAPLHGWHVTAFVERDADNRVLRVEADNGDTWYRATDVQLDGDKAPGVVEIWWPYFVPCGEYVVAARTFNSVGVETGRVVEHPIICVTPEPGQ